MIEIHLTKGYVSLIDDCDADLNQLAWTASVHPRQVYAVQQHRRNGKKGTTHLHRVVLERMLNRPMDAKEYCDHINGDSLDNRRNNLRVALPHENSRNQQTRITSKSGYKGVIFDKRNKKFKAQIGIGGKPLYLGLFPTVEAAARAYNEAALEHFGEFARLNEIP
jgi:hypothetical protein